jgi:hypothetical protein
LLDKHKRTLIAASLPHYAAKRPAEAGRFDFALTFETLKPLKL